MWDGIELEKVKIDAGKIKVIKRNHFRKVLGSLSEGEWKWLGGEREFRYFSITIL